MSVLLYIEHLTDGDLDLLARSGGHSTVDDLLVYLRANPGYAEVLLRDGSLFSRVFEGEYSDALLRASPFLSFALLLHRAEADLAGRHFVEEWLGPGRRVPMFEVDSIRDFAASVDRRLFLAELLASYTRVASGSYWTHTNRGWRRRRFSELDPLRLIEMLEAAPERDRPLLYRRLGDLALFLTGVFPDHTGRRFLLPIPSARLHRAVPGAEAGGDGLYVLEELGRRAYQSAWHSMEPTAGQRLTVLNDVAEGFGQARRLLNFLTDRYLFSRRDHLFPAEG
jgi:hypothetical protein